MKNNFVLLTLWFMLQWVQPEDWDNMCLRNIDIHLPKYKVDLRTIMDAFRLDNSVVPSRNRNTISRLSCPTTRCRLFVEKYIIKLY
jgi:hypothetical protein